MDGYGNCFDLFLLLKYGGYCVKEGKEEGVEKVEEEEELVESCIVGEGSGWGLFEWFFRVS